MSTYPASLVRPGTFCSGEGPEVTTQPHTLPQQRRYNKRRGRRQQQKRVSLPDHVIQTMTWIHSAKVAPQLNLLVKDVMRFITNQVHLALKINSLTG